MKNNALKIKIIMIILLLSFMFFYMMVFGSKNAAIGLTIVLAAFMNASDDFSYKPKSSFFKVLGLLLILCIAAYLNNPVSIVGCILTFLVVFGTTFTSYHLFSDNVYMPYLMCYFMMMCIPVPFEDFPMRILSLVFGAVFIVGFNLLVNHNKPQKLTKQAIDNLVGEVDNAVDLKLQEKEVPKGNFKIVNNFYSAIFSQFAYKRFPSPIQESAINIVKSFQYIGTSISDFELSKSELLYIKEILENIKNNRLDDVFDQIKIEHDEFSIILLNFENIIDEIKTADFTKDTVLPDKNTIKASFKPVIRESFSFRSAKFTFAIKMAFVLMLWEVLTLIFNLPFTKWLYFATISLMLPYVNDMAYNSKARLKGTIAGAFVFVIIILIMPYLPISKTSLMLIIFITCMCGLVFNIKDKLIMSIFSTVMSIMFSMIYITPTMGITLKILWVAVAVIVVTAINYLFLPYSVEKETKNNLMLRSKLNEDSIDLIRNEKNSSKKTTIMVLSNIVGENIEITDENKELFEVQSKITDVSDFILTYINKHELPDDFKDKLIDVLDNGGEVNVNLDIRYRAILRSTKYLAKLFKKEKELIGGI